MEDKVSRLISVKADWLVDRIAGYGSEYGYDRYLVMGDSYLKDLLSALFSSLVSYLRDEQGSRDPGDLVDQLSRFMVQCGVEDQVIACADVFCLLKAVRRSYVKLIRDAGLDRQTENQGVEITGRFFDHVEIAFRKHLQQTLFIESVVPTGLARLILDAAGEGVFGINLAGDVIFVNPAGERILGWSAGELIGKHQHRLCHHTRTDGSVYPEEQCPIYMAYKDGVVHSGSDEVFWRRDGTAVPIEYTSTPIRKDGRLLGSVVVFRDISERKRLEKLLFDEKEQFRVTLSSIGDAVLTTDPEGLVTFMNPLAEHLTGYNLVEAMGSPVTAVFRVFNEETGEPAEIPIKRVLREGKTSGLANHTVLVSRDGSVFPIADSASPIQDESGGVSGVVMVFRDNTERKLVEGELTRAKEEAEAANRAKDEFLANMSHEIRTPMNSILGMAELLGETSLTEEQRDYVLTIHESSNLLLGIINDVLDFSQIQAGKMTLEKVHFDPRVVVESILRIVGFKARAKGLKLRTEIDSELPPLLCGDPVRLRQILLNLTFNAIKFTGEGEVCLRLAVLGGKGGRLTVRFEISDTGIGLSEEERQRIFLPFVQADGSYSRLYGGTGLGLAIARWLVQQMGGQIGVDSEPGCGSTFWLTVRLERVLDEEEGRDQAERVSEPSQLSGRPSGPILLAEDNPVNRKLTLVQLKKLGYRAQAVNNGREAVVAALTGDYALVIMDLQMPVMDGFEAIRAIRERESAIGRHIPVIALTAHAFEGYRDRSIAAGADDYLTKPIRSPELRRALVTWMEPDRVEGELSGALPRVENPAGEVIGGGLLWEIIGEQEDRLTILKEVFEIFTNDMRERLAAVRRAVAVEDAVALIEIAHSMKSGSNAVGARTLALIAAELETLGKSGTTAGGEELIIRAQEAYDQTLIVMETMLREG